MKAATMTLTTQDVLGLQDASVRQAPKVRVVLVLRTNERRCGHCNEPLPFLEKLLRKRFCSSAHKRDHANAMESMMLDRLQQWGERLRVAREKQHTKDRAAAA